MNEQFKKLAEQALREVTANGFSDETYRADGYLPSVSKAFADKFAELIVKECIHMMKIATSGPDETTPELRVQEFCIKQHFGINK